MPDTPDPHIDVDTLNAQQSQGMIIGSTGPITQYFNAPPTRPLFAGVPTLPDHFVGRDDLLNTVVEQLIAGQTKALSSEGMPGAGKTTLGVAIAHDSRVLEHFKDGVLWASLGTQPDVMSALASWADDLHVDVTKYPDADARSQAVKNAIGQRRLLLVIDDAWQIEPARLLRCSGPNCCHLLTTRNSAIAIAFAGADHCHHVPELEHTPAYKLLRILAPKACAADPQLSNHLAQAVGGLPLAIELLGGYLAAPERSAFEILGKEALDELTDPHHRLQLASARLGDAARRTILLQDTIALSLSDLPDTSQKAFYALSAFAAKPDTFTFDAAVAVTQSDAKTLAQLIARNLLEQPRKPDQDEQSRELSNPEQSHESDNTLAIHQVIADFARATPDSVAMSRHRAFYLASANQNPQDWRQIESIYGQVKHAWTQLPDELIVIDFVWALRVYQERRGLWHDFIDWAQRGLAVAERGGQRKGAGTLLSNIGFGYDSLGQRDKALDYYTRALSIRREVGDRTGEATTLNNLGLVYYNLGQRERALDYFNQSLPISHAVGDRVGEATTLSNLGLVYDSLGQHDKALAYYTRALPIHQEVGDRAVEATTLNHIGEVYHSMGRRDKALAYYTQALPIHQAVGHRTGEATTLNNIGAVYYALGQREQALDYYTRALTIHQETSDHDGEATTLNNIGMIHYALGQRERALAYFAQALPILREVGNRAREAVTLNNLGLIYDSLGQRDKAQDYYTQALSIHREVGDRSGEATTLNNLGLVYSSLRQHEQALAYFAQALPTHQETGDRDGEASTFNNIGMIHYALGQRERALAYFTQALPIRQETGDRDGEASTLNNIGAVHYSLGQHEQALDYYTRALSMHHDTGNRDGEATTLHNIGVVYRQLGQHEQALDYYTRALPIRQEVGDRAGEALTHSNIAMIYHDQGRLADAITHLRRTVELDQLTQNPDLDSDQAMLAQLEFELAAGAAPSGAS